MLRQTAWVVMLLGCVSVAVGEVRNWIYQHNPYYNNPQNPGYPFYEIEQPSRTIRVYGGVPGEVFQFEAVVEDSNHQYVGPGDINKIETVGFARDAVVTFVGHNGHPYGAANIKELRIDQPSVTGVIQALDISNDLGQYGPIRSAAVGTMTIAGDVLNDVGIWTDLTGSLTVGGDVEFNIYAGGAIAGPVTVMGDLCSDPTRVRLMCASLGSLSVGRDVVGYIQVEGAIAGPVTVTGGLCTRPWASATPDSRHGGQAPVRRYCGLA